jgi:hypothetical protein
LEATFTEDSRAAAELLLEYLCLKELESVKLTGHAETLDPHGVVSTGLLFRSG